MTLRVDKAKAQTRFRELGFPTTREEGWRYTNVAPIAKLKLQSAAKPARIDRAKLEAVAFASFPAERMVFVNGVFVPELSSLAAGVSGAQVLPLTVAMVQRPAWFEASFGLLAPWKDNVFAALNASSLSDGAAILVSKGKKLDRPIHLIFAMSEKTEGAFAAPRVLVVAEEGSAASIVESYVSLEDGATFTNPVAEILVGRNASVRHIRVQRESEKSFQVGTTNASVARDGRYHSTVVTMGGALVRNDLSVLLDGEGAECTLDGFYMTRGKQHADNHTTIEHATPHGTSRELYKGLLLGESRAVFHGRIVVQPHAQKTDAQQSNKNLLLSKSAEANTKPQLEIYANDVKCKHGATVGQLDEKAIFYLLSRGIGEDEARGILAHAFADEVIDRIEIPEIRRGLDALLLEELPKHQDLREVS